MKVLVIALASIMSLSTLAQGMDKVDFILYSGYSEGFARPAFKTAKVEITRERYNRMMNEKLVMICKVTTDPDMMLVFYDGQVTAHHKKGKSQVNHCEATGCNTESFEDLSTDSTGASNGKFLVDEGKTWSYLIGSVAFFNEFKRIRDWGLPEISEIPYVTIFDPAIHTNNKVPVKNSFGCYIKDANGNFVSP